MREFLKSFGHDILNIAVGALVAWVISYVYYVKAGKDLVEETQRLRALHTTTLRALENLQNKNVNFHLDPDELGDPTRMGVEVKVQGSEAHTSAPQASATGK
jgi:hypothetical protein